MHYLSISCIIRNESLYLRDWVSFHLKQGVEHFYLYDNSEPGEPDHRETVREYDNFITWHPFPGRCMQRAACNHTIHSYKKDTFYCTFIDVDEYLYAGNGNLKESINNRFIAGVSALAVHWLIFGSSGELEYRNAPVIERFIYRANEVNHHVKTIVKLRDALHMGNNVHTIRVKKKVVDENLAVLPVEYALSTPATAEYLRLNHYVTKSKEECRIRRALPRADHGSIRPPEFFDAHDRNEVEDRRILEFA